MKIKNINGTSNASCGCGAWLKHWEKFSGQKTIYCQAIGCLNTDVVGAHVQKSDGLDRSWYIYPLCNAHNKSSTELEVSDTYTPVSANKLETREKKKTYGSILGGF